MWLFDNAAPICSYAIREDAAPPSRFTRVVISAPPLLRQIAKDIGMTLEEFLSFR